MTKFAAGDRVICVDNEGVEHLLEFGGEYVVREFLRDAGGEIVHLKDGGDGFYPTRFRLAEGAPAPHGVFGLGDKVRIKDSLMNGEFAGRAANVVSFREDFASHGVKIDGFPYVVFFHPNKLELIENPEAKDEEQEDLIREHDELDADGWETMTEKDTYGTIDPRSFETPFMRSIAANREVVEEALEYALKSDNVHQPHHYARFTIEPITFINANGLPYNIGNVIKYACRYDAKNGVEDLRKAMRYLEIHIETLERQERVKAGEDPRDVWKVTI